MKIEAGKYYRIRDGRKALVLSTTVPSIELPILGYVIINETTCIICQWFADGSYSMSTDTSNLDIVAEWEESKSPKPKRLAYVDNLTHHVYMVPLNVVHCFEETHKSFIRIPYLDEPEV